MAVQENRTQTNSPAGVPMKIALIGAAIALVLIFAAYFIGKAKVRGQMDAQKTNYEKQLSDGRAQTQQAQTSLASAQAQNAFLQARGSLYRTAVALDRRNFGVASNYVQKAAQQLDSVDAAAAGLDASEFADVKAKIQAIHISVAQDLQTQRDQVIAAAVEMDSLLPPTS